MPRGGRRTPRNPAPVSGPGALSQRTDGGQPVRLPSGGDYGDRQALEQQQQAAPMAARGGAPQGVSPGGGGGGAPAGPMDVFGPTERPGEPVTEGVPVGPGSPGVGVLPPDPDEFARAVYAQVQTEDLRRLLEYRDQA